MWKQIDGRLKHTTDDSRVKFRTNISRYTLDCVRTLAEYNDTHINYLLESGLRALLAKGEISYDKENRPKDRIQFKSSYDKDLLEELKAFANKHGLHANDVIEYSVKFINLEESKNSKHRYRKE